MTPVTPNSAGGIAWLDEMIKQDAESMDDTENSKQRFQRHIEKLTKATQVSFAERALLSEQVQFLGKINDEAEILKMARGIVIGNARIMSYKDLEKAGEESAWKTAEKDARKANNDAKKAAKAAREAGQADLDPASSLSGKQSASRKWRRVVEEDENEDEINARVTIAVWESEDGILERWMAPVAKDVVI